ncbi:MATE family efflux transporter [Lachnospiraceae bacterium]|nr:MATE family efflux transporter [Lachnospiraceae bacterium]
MKGGQKNKSYEIDMCHGPLLGKILLFSVPLMLSGILQLLFNAADVVVVGRFAGSQSLAAVGSTSSLINMLTNIFIGLSVGTNVLIAHYYGAGQEKEVSETVHTSVLLSVVCGIILTVLGVGLAKPLLELMGTPEDVLDKAALYMRIYFVGMPVMLLYNFGSSILRAIGDTKRPLYYLTAAGVVNVALNLFFVITLQMDVAGVALATILSQCISAGCIVVCLMKTEGSFRMIPRQLRIHKDKLLRIIRIGLPAGMQGAIFSVSNVLIQSSVNSFGSLVMAGNTAASNIEGFVYTAMNAMHQTAVSFTGQNLGGKQFDRINKVLFQCLIIVAVVGLVLGNGAAFFGRHILRLYSSDGEVIEYGMIRLSIICTYYCLCGMMDTMVGAIRGLGYSVMPMVVSLIGACGLRVLWVMTIFQWERTLLCLYISYPVSWTITFAVHVICYVAVRNWMKKTYG